MYMTAKKSNELATGFCRDPCRNGERASFPGPSVVPCSVQTVPLCTLQGINRLETWSLGMRLQWTGDMKSGLRWTSYTSNHDKKDNYLTVIKLFFNSQDIVCFARHSVQTFNIQTCEEQQNNNYSCVALNVDVDMKMGVCGRDCWMGQQGIVLGSTAWHYTLQSRRVFVTPNVGRLLRSFWHLA